MSEPTREQLLHHKFYRCVAFEPGTGRRVKIAVWNGVEDYSYDPTLFIEMYASGKVVVMQLAKVGVNFLPDVITDADCVVIWAKNAEVYQGVVDLLKVSERASTGL